MYMDFIGGFYSAYVNSNFWRFYVKIRLNIIYFLAYHVRT